MEALIIAAGLYLLYVVLDRFDPAIEGLTELSNGKIVITKQEQALKNAKKRSKIKSKLDDIEIISDKELDNLLKGKKSKAED